MTAISKTSKNLTMDWLAEQVSTVKDQVRSQLVQGARDVSKVVRTHLEVLDREVVGGALDLLDRADAALTAPDQQ